MTWTLATRLRSFQMHGGLFPLILADLMNLNPPTYLDPTDCSPRQRNLRVHLRVDPALDEALVDLLAVPGPVRLRAQRAAAVLAENSFATLVIKMMITMRVRMRRRRNRKLPGHLEPSQTPCTSTYSQEP